jgi:hypothetical protein
VQSLSFLRPGVLSDVSDEHRDWADDDEGEDVKWVHFDSCAFGESVAQINAFYRDALANLVPGPSFDPWSATDDFGRAQHPIQDFYAHSNWVELGFPRGEDPLTSDLVDFGTRLTGPSQLGLWRVPAALTPVRDDILLADLVLTTIRDLDHRGALDVVDANGDGRVSDRDATVLDLPAQWTAGLLPHPTRPGDAGFVPGVDVDGDAELRTIQTAGLPVVVLTSGDDFRLLTTGVGGRPIDDVFGNQCDPYMRDAQGRVRSPKKLNSCPVTLLDDYSCIAFGGSRFALTHSGSARSELNKDRRSAAPTRFPRAIALARLQSKYEWCRFVYQAGRVGSDGILLALWVRENASPNPTGTPCRSNGTGGPLGVTVSIDRVTVLNDKDNGDDEPGEINLSLVLYDSPFNFGRSVKSKAGPTFADDDGSTAARRLSGARVPSALSMCIQEAGGSAPFRVALHGWDDDEGSDRGPELRANGDYNSDGSTPDDALIGFTRTHEATSIPIGSAVTEAVSSDDLQISYRISRLPDMDGDGLDTCGESFHQRIRNP